MKPRRRCHGTSARFGRCTTSIVMKSSTSYLLFRNLSAGTCFALFLRRHLPCIYIRRHLPCLLLTSGQAGGACSVKRTAAPIDRAAVRRDEPTKWRATFRWHRPPHQPVVGLARVPRGVAGRGLRRLRLCLLSRAVQEEVILPLHQEAP